MKCVSFLARMSVSAVTSVFVFSLIGVTSLKLVPHIPADCGLTLLLSYKNSEDLHLFHVPRVLFRYAMEDELTEEIINKTEAVFTVTFTKMKSSLIFARNKCSIVFMYVHMGQNGFDLPLLFYYFYVHKFSSILGTSARITLMYFRQPLAQFPANLFQGLSLLHHNYFIPRYFIVYQMMETSLKICAFDGNSNRRSDNTHRCIFTKTISPQILQAIEYEYKQWNVHFMYLNNDELKPSLTQNNPFIVDYIDKYVLDQIIILKANCSYNSFSPATVDKANFLPLSFAYGYQLQGPIQREIRFLTCYSRPLLSFSMYVNPFDLGNWIGLIMTGVFLAAFITFLTRRLELQKHFSSLLFIVCSILDDYPAIPKKSRKSK